jgi:hypothetical protein
MADGIVGERYWSTQFSAVVAQREVLDRERFHVQSFQP